MKVKILIVAIVGSLFMAAASAEQDKNMEQLLERIQAMEERIAILESRFSFASFMPDFAERFHVMHRATESEDWAVASHELQEMRGMMESSTTIDSEKGNLFKVMMGPVIEEMADAIAHSNSKKMAATLDRAVQACNNCHVATGSPFINVTLDASGTLSIRHPHAFKMQKMGSHMH